MTSFDVTGPSERRANAHAAVVNDAAALGLSDPKVTALDVDPTPNRPTGGGVAMGYTPGHASSL